MKKRRSLASLANSPVTAIGIAIALATGIGLLATSASAQTQPGAAINQQTPGVNPTTLPTAPAAPATAAPAVAPAVPAAPGTPPAPAAPGKADLVIRTMGPVSYVCGGIADDEQRQLAARQKDFNMGLLFTQGPSGEFLSDVDVKLMRDGHEVAKFRTSGPRCLIRAPEGRYNVQATYNGQPKSVTVSTGTLNTQIRW